MNESISGCKACAVPCLPGNSAWLPIAATPYPLRCVQLRLLPPFPARLSKRQRKLYNPCLTSPLCAFSPHSRLSKRQRKLYEEYMASGNTRATLASGNFLGIMNCLMQLRKVSGCGVP